LQFTTVAGWLLTCMLLLMLLLLYLMPFLLCRCVRQAAAP
jgi:hypothetical protein